MQVTDNARIIKIELFDSFQHPSLNVDDSNLSQNQFQLLFSLKNRPQRGDGRVARLPLRQVAVQTEPLGHPAIRILQQTSQENRRRLHPILFHQGTRSTH